MGSARALLAFLGTLALVGIVWFAWPRAPTAAGPDRAGMASEAPRPQRDSEPPGELVRPDEAGRPREELQAVEPAAAESAAARAPARAKLLAGRLLGPDGGAPPGRGREVWLIELDDAGAPRGGGERAQAQVAADGGFALRIPGWAEERPSLLVGRAFDHLPASRVIAPEETGEVVLQLGRGAELRGRVTFQGEPVPGWPVDLDLRFGVPGVFDAGQEGFWIGGRFVEKHARTITGTNGSFRFTGFVEDTYDLRCTRVGQSLPQVLERKVRVDGASVELELGGPQLAVLVTGAGQVVEGAEVRVGAEGNTTDFRSGAAPELVTVVGAGRVTLRARHPVHAEGELVVELDPGAARTDVVMDLTPVQRPSLHVHLPGADAAGVDAVELDVMPRSGARAEARPLHLTERIAADTFHLAVLPADPGPHELRLRSVGPFRSEVVRLEVPPDGVLSASFAGLQGGRYRVALEADAESWSANWWIDDAAGQRAVPVHHHARTRDMAFAWGEGLHEALAFGERPTLRPDTDVLAAGRYVLVVEAEGHLPHREEFEIRVGEEARLDVHLRPEGR